MLSTPISEIGTSETQLTLMTKRRGFQILGLWLVSCIVAVIISFSPKATNVETGHSIPTSTALKELNIRLQFSGYDSMCSTLFIGFIPSFAQSTHKRTITLRLKGDILLLDENMAKKDTKPIDSTYNYDVKAGIINDFDLQKIIQFSNIDFKYVLLSIDVITSHADLNDILVKAISIRKELTITGVVFISILTIMVSLLLILIISKRVRPKYLDHWLVIILAGVLLLVDGPWLLCQYYSIASFSQVFDMMPQIFHAFFVIYAFAFFSVRTIKAVKKIYKNKIIYCCIICFSIILLILQFTITKRKPLPTLAFYKKDNKSILAILIILFLLYHGGIIFGFIYGFIKLQFEKLIPILIIGVIFCSAEAIEIIEFLIRISVGYDHFGLSMAADILYILMANIITLVLLYVDTPVSQQSDHANCKNDIRI